MFKVEAFKVVKVPAAAVLEPIIVLSKLDIVKLLKVPAAGVVPPIVTPSIVPPSKATFHRGWFFSSCKAYKAWSTLLFRSVERIEDPAANTPLGLSTSVFLNTLTSTPFFGAPVLSCKVLFRLVLLNVILAGARDTVYFVAACTPPFKATFTSSVFNTGNG